MYRLLQRAFSSCTPSHAFGGKGLQRIKCSKCGELAPADQALGFFELLGEKPTFTVDVAQLKERFLEAQKVLHPDHPGDRERREHWSALYNRAWECLRDPLCRATILYNAQCPNDGFEEILSETKDLAASEDGDDELLDLVLEARMALEEAEDAADVQAVQEANEERIGETVADMEAAFDVGNMERVRDLIIRLRYWYSLRSACKDHPLYP